MRVINTSLTCCCSSSTLSKNGVWKRVDITFAKPRHHRKKNTYVVIIIRKGTGWPRLRWDNSAYRRVAARSHCIKAVVLWVEVVVKEERRVRVN
jgi:hypothetical protein